MADNTQLGLQRRSRIVLWGCALSLLLLPLIAMQFTEEVNWDLADFIVFGIMLFIACGGFELATRMTKNTAYKIAIGLAIASVFLLVWMQLAVGLFR